MPRLLLKYAGRTGCVSHSASGPASHIAGGISAVATGAAAGIVTIGAGTIGVHAAVTGVIAAFGANCSVGSDGGVLGVGGPLGRGRGRRGPCGGCCCCPCGGSGGQFGGCGSVCAVIIPAGGQHCRGKDECERQNTDSFHSYPPVCFKVRM